MVLWHEIVIAAISFIDRFDFLLYLLWVGVGTIIAIIPEIILKTIAKRSTVATAADTASSLLGRCLLKGPPLHVEEELLVGNVQD